MTRFSPGGRGVLARGPEAVATVALSCLALGVAPANSTTSKLSEPWKVLAEHEHQNVRYQLQAGFLEPESNDSVLESSREVRVVCPGSVDPDGGWYFVLTGTPLDSDSPGRVLGVTRGFGVAWHLQVEPTWLAALDVSDGVEPVAVSWVLMTSINSSMNRFYVFETTTLASTEWYSNPQPAAADLWSQVEGRELEVPRFEASVEREDLCFPTELGLAVDGAVWTLHAWNPDFQPCGEFELTLDRSGDIPSWQVLDRETGIVKSPGDPSPEKWPPIEVFDTDGCEVFESSK